MKINWALNSGLTVLFSYHFEHIEQSNSITFKASIIVDKVSAVSLIVFFWVGNIFYGTLIFCSFTIIGLGVDLFVFILISTETALWMSVFYGCFSFISLRILNTFILRSFQIVLLFSFCLEWIDFSVVDFFGNCGVSFLHVFWNFGLRA